ncbi:hypothetical protein Vafri_2499 [Volvox africanus]|uniref:Uncharacterized protein n=1 Tax=Volvox africanus TaxID=51714 RepID=A0A8J4ARK2_9CHLO|nr:hypothetical protein Vafri_2499 [Volvox africanus]
MLYLLWPLKKDAVPRPFLPAAAAARFPAVAAPPCPARFSPSTPGPFRARRRFGRGTSVPIVATIAAPVTAAGAVPPIVLVFVFTPAFAATTLAPFTSSPMSPTCSGTVDGTMTARPACSGDIARNAPSCCRAYAALPTSIAARRCSASPRNSSTFASPPPVLLLLLPFSRRSAVII